MVSFYLDVAGIIDNSLEKTTQSLVCKLSWRKFKTFHVNANIYLIKRHKTKD